MGMYRIILPNDNLQIDSQFWLQKGEKDCLQSGWLHFIITL